MANNFCGKCGSKLDDNGRCPKCDNDVNVDTYCSVCGSKIDKITGLCLNCANKSNKTNKAAVPKKPLIIGIVVVMLVVCSIGFIYAKNKLDGNTNSEITYDVLLANLESRNTYLYENSTVINELSASTSENVLSESGVIRYLNIRGFNSKVYYRYTLSGEELTPSVALDSSEDKHPEYISSYVSSNGTSWLITVINGDIIATSLPSLSRPNIEDQITIIEKDTLTIYSPSEDKFYELSPNENIKDKIMIVEEINSKILDSIKLDNDNDTSLIESEKNSNQKATISPNSLSYLKLVNNGGNVVYSPLSINYALSMLSDASSGTTKKQLESLLNGYTPLKYANSENLSLANALIVKDSVANQVSDSLKNTLSEKYDAELLTDSFSSPDLLNQWIEEKTLGMISNYLDSINPDLKFLVINCLAIDMEWVNKIQNDFSIGGTWERYGVSIYSPEMEEYTLSFNGTTTKGSKFAALGNKYDIISDLGEDNIRKTVGDALREYMKENPNDQYDVDDYLDQYIEDIKTNYGDYGQSTDFYYYDDDNIKVFAKDLKEYNGTQFQYIGIMPNQEDLSSYINNVTDDDIATIIGNLKEPSYESFEEGYVTEITGIVPWFDFTYDLDLDACLKELGVTEMFNLTNDFSSVTSEPVSITTKHRSTIDFSNDGIKASAVTYEGGLGGAGGGFEYWFDVPTIKIDLTFDKPFMFIIRNKDTNEVWFVGTMYGGDATNSVKPTLYVWGADSIKIRKEPTTSAEQLGSAKKYESYASTGKTVSAEGYTWYELEQGGWIADNGEWLMISNS